MQHLTYCTNIHAGESWNEVRDALGRYVPAIKERVSPHAPFGVGLRLSDRASRELDRPDELAAFVQFLGESDLYVFTINGFPYGNFHGERVKERVYLPDWRSTQRLEYSNRLAGLLAALLPAGVVAGSISTMPGAFRGDLRDEAADRHAIAMRLLEHALVLHHLHEETGKLIVLGLEAEPSCLLETTADAIEFFETSIVCKDAIAGVVASSGLHRGRAEELLRRHLGICLDTCHAAVEFEEPRETVRMIRDSGIAVAKMQLSAGLRVANPNARSIEALAPFAEDVYLHQVVERTPDGLRRHVDLPELLADVPAADSDEWRIHFHVPIWADALGEFQSTRPFLEDILTLHREEPITTNLEVETYTWDVLPPAYRTENVVDAIARELRWVMERL